MIVRQAWCNTSKACESMVARATLFQLSDDVAAPLVTPLFINPSTSKPKRTQCRDAVRGAEQPCWQAHGGRQRQPPSSKGLLLLPVLAPWTALLVTILGLEGRVGVPVAGKLRRPLKTWEQAVQGAPLLCTAIHALQPPRAPPRGGAGAAQRAGEWRRFWPCRSPVRLLSPGCVWSDCLNHSLHHVMPVAPIIPSRSMTCTRC